MSGFRPIADALRAMAEARPEGIATAVPGRARELSAPTDVRYEITTFRALDRRTDAIAHGLVALGVTPGTKVALLVPPSTEFFALAFALLRVGAVPVLVDPGIGVPALKTCLGEAAPEVFIGVPKAHLARQVLRWCPGLKLKVTVGGGAAALFLGGGVTLAEVERRGEARLAEGNAALPSPGPEDLAAIVFTSGSTGIPKGVEYVQRNFAAQVELIREAYGITPGTVNVATFPPFALFGPALQMSTIVPRMDPTRPARVDPREVKDAAERFGATLMFGSPALLDTVSRYGELHGTRIAGIRTVISAGAPVPPRVIRRMLAMLDAGAEIFTPYGATECMPVTNVRSSEILALTEARAGICVGVPSRGLRVGIVRVEDGAMESIGDGDLLPAGHIGEVVVSGPNVTRAYYGRAEATRLAKTRWNGELAHRMGDLGWFDEAGRLWFAGRKVHRVPTAHGVLYSVPVEEVFGRHPSVKRAALVGANAGADAGAGERATGPLREPVLWVELERGATDTPALREEILAFGRANADGTGAEHVTRVLVHRGFPVDIRHNSKINREKLALEVP